MIKNKIDIEGSIIDSYYNESPEKDTGLSCNNDSFDISDKLNAVSQKLDNITNIDFDLDVNILSIIQNAEDIKVKKKNKLETSAFILTALLILSSLLIMGTLWSFKVLAYLEIISGSVMPFVLIPLAKVYKNKGGV